METPLRYLARCPCGEIPEKLCISDAHGRWSYVSGYCCGEWNVEFRSDHKKPDDPELIECARRAWNLALRVSVDSVDTIRKT